MALGGEAGHWYIVWCVHCALWRGERGTIVRLQLYWGERIGAYSLVCLLCAVEGRENCGIGQRGETVVCPLSAVERREGQLCGYNCRIGQRGEIHTHTHTHTGGDNDCTIPLSTRHGILRALHIAIATGSLAGIALQNCHMHCACVCV